MASRPKRRHFNLDDEQMARRLRTPPAEVLDSVEVRNEKIEKLTEIFKSDKNIVIITGAGISTAAQIPDYRGVNGLYTRNIDNFNRRFDIRETNPTLSHMVIRELLRNKYATHLISQNCDGLHLRTGIAQQYLSEIHGNMFVEFCRWCLKEHVRPYEVSYNSRFGQHISSRCTGCRWWASDTIVHAGEKSQTIWPQNWAMAIEEVNAADVILIVGTSGVVLKNYETLWPEHAEKILVNTQPSMIDDKVDWKIGATCDQVFGALAKNLDLKTLNYCRDCDTVLNSKIRTTWKTWLKKFRLCQCHIREPIPLVLKKKKANLGCPGWLKSGLRRMRRMYIYPEMGEDDFEHSEEEEDDAWSPKHRKRRQPIVRASRSVKPKVENPNVEKPKRGRPRTVKQEPEDVPSTSQQSAPKKRGRKPKFVRRTGRPPRSRSRSVDVEISSLADDHEDIIEMQNHVNDPDLAPPISREVKIEDLSSPPPPPHLPIENEPTVQPINFGRVLSERLTHQRRDATSSTQRVPEENYPPHHGEIPGVRNLLAAFDSLGEADRLPTVDEIINNVQPQVPEHMALSLNSLRRGIVEQRERGAPRENEQRAYNALAIGYEQAYVRQEERRAARAAAAAAPVPQQNEIEADEAEQRDLEYLREHNITPPAILDNNLRRRITVRRRQQHEEYFREQENNIDLQSPEQQRLLREQFNDEIQQELEDIPLAANDRPALNVADYQGVDRTTPPGFLNELDEPEDPEPIEAPPPIAQPQEPQQQVVEPMQVAVEEPAQQVVVEQVQTVNEAPNQYQFALPQQPIQQIYQYVQYPNQNVGYGNEQYLENVSEHMEVVRHAIEPEFNNFFEPQNYVQFQQPPQQQQQEPIFGSDIIPFPEDFLEPTDEPAAPENPSYADLASAPRYVQPTLGVFQYNEFSADMHANYVPNNAQPVQIEAQHQQPQEMPALEQIVAPVQTLPMALAALSAGATPMIPVGTGVIINPGSKPRKSRSKKSAGLLRLEDFAVLEPGVTLYPEQKNFDNIMHIVFSSYGQCLQISQIEFDRFKRMFMDRFGKSTGELQLQQLRQMMRMFKQEHCKKQ